MFRSLPALYRNAYSGLSPSMWIQALVMLINRSGTMVIPFMTVYLTQSLHFSIAESGEVLSVFGAGAICGVYAGGKLTDNIGFFPVQFWSLLLNGLLFLVLGQLRHLLPICGCVFLLALIGEAFRPANAAATAFYSSPDNRTRSYSLNRLAINLGFAIGPAAGGLLATISYGWLFWTDGLTCIIAALILNWLLRPARGVAVAFAGARPGAAERPGVEAVGGSAVPDRGIEGPAPSEAGEDADDMDADGAVAGMPGQDVPEPAHAAAGIDSAVPVLSAYRDRTYLRFIFFVWMNALSFFQLFSVVPLYYKTAIHMSDAGIGLILAMNGLLIAVIEMVLVYKLENKRPDTLYIGYGVLLTALSFGLLAIGPYLWVAVLSMLFITFGEMMSMPFMNSYWISRSSLRNRGQYAALYGIAYSAAQVIAPALGGQVVQHWGFGWLWVILVGVGLLTFWGFRRGGVGGVTQS
jgi:predicted MFS family arabinose efflux permease